MNQQEQKAFDQLREALELLRYAMTNGDSNDFNQAISQCFASLTAAKEVQAQVEPRKYSDIVSDGGLDPRNAATPQAQRLSDAEIREWWGKENGLEDCVMCKIDDFTKVTRAIETAFCSKNGIHLGD